MRISDHILPIALFSLGLGLGLTTTASAFDGTKSTDSAGMHGWGAIAPDTPLAVDSPNLKAWRQKMQIGDLDGAAEALREAARHGDVMAAWKLGRMYADGADGVKKDEQQAFEYFRQVIETQHVEDTVGTSQGGFVGQALVALGEYYLNGIPNSDMKPNPVEARQKFYYAASYFGDSRAQYHLGRMYLDGQGGAKDTKNAARWLHNAAMKGQYEAQAVFGGMLFKGQSVPRDGAKGLMFLKLAMDAATPKETWIADQYNAAWKQATEDERAVALVHVEHWREQQQLLQRH
jgi:TPR repeat protein